MKICLNRTGALGDVLEVTAITKRLLAEGHHVFVKTNYPQVFVGLGVNVASPNWFGYDKSFDLNLAFERDLRQLHPIDSFSKIVFGDTLTPHKIYFNYPKTKTLTINKKPVTGAKAVLHAARSWPIRTLPRGFWQDLINELVLIDFVVILTGTSQDWDGLYGATDLRDKLTLPEQASLIDLADVFICSESGPMILAQATNTPIIPLLTMIIPEHITHDGPAIYPILAPVPCQGCALRHPAPTTYFDCLNQPDTPEFRQCLESFDPTDIATLAESIVFNDEPQDQEEPSS
jgi:heptosyltransferase III